MVTTRRRGRNNAIQTKTTTSFSREEEEEENFGFTKMKKTTKKSKSKSKEQQQQPQKEALAKEQPHLRKKDKDRNKNKNNLKIRDSNAKIFTARSRRAFSRRARTVSFRSVRRAVPGSEISEMALRGLPDVYENRRAVVCHS